MADELEENYVLDSDDEYHDGGGEAGETIMLPYDVEPVQGKRKHRHDDQDDDDVAPRGDDYGDEDDDEMAQALAAGADRAPGSTSTTTSGERNKRRRMAKKARKAERMMEASAAGTGAGRGGRQEERLAVLPPDVQAEHMRTLLARAYPTKSGLELAEMQVPEEAFVPVTSMWPERGLDTLVPLLRRVDPELAPRGEQVELLVVSGNANRCTDLARALRALLGPARSGQSNKSSNNKDKARGRRVKGKGLPGGRADDEAVIAKLFARHMKRSEQAALLRSRTTRTPVAVGTPGRIEALLDPGEEDAAPALASSGVRYVVLDTTWKDAKMFSLLDSPDTKRDVFSLLAHPALRQQWRSGSTRLILF